MDPALRAEFGIEGEWATVRRHSIRWSECDQFAHANNTAYLLLCEDSRVAHWLEIGGRFALDSPGPLVARIEAEFRRSVAFGDEVAVTLRPLALRRTSFTTEYAVWKQGLIFRSKAVLVSAVPSSGEKVPLTPEIRAALIAQGATEE
ncbi:acyl-CoA thioesterase [Siccirubricoccus phaeus]|uniref:acyl-CoA thioesterase n=1 Tax=Siccirubricoccus phaeus TaxID=2595053 RepID=UPI0011F0AAA5|nr:thioesterase family protein [Siccirubricoccus phaeus]